MICPACDHDNIQGADLCDGCEMDLAGLDVQAWGVSPRDPVLGMRLDSLKLKDPIVLERGSSVQRAIDGMKQHHEGCIFIEDDGRLVGVLTERDIALRIAVRGRDPSRTSVDEVMTPSPVTLQRGDALAWALHRMGVDGHRHLPVLDGERLVGFLSMRAVLQALLEA